MQFKVPTIPEITIKVSSNINIEKEIEKNLLLPLNISSFNTPIGNPIGVLNANTEKNKNDYSITHNEIYASILCNKIENFIKKIKAEKIIFNIKSDSLPKPMLGGTSGRSSVIVSFKDSSNKNGWFEQEVTDMKIFTVYFTTIFYGLIKTHDCIIQAIKENEYVKIYNMSSLLKNKYDNFYTMLYLTCFEEELGEEKYQELLNSINI